MTRLYTLVFLMISIIGASYAATIEFTPYLNAGISHQDNLFLVANDEEAISVLDTTKQADNILEISPGIRTELDHLQQKIFLDVSLLRREFDRFDSLNFNGGDAKLQWDWLYSSNWDGIAAYRYTKKQSDFNEQLGRLGDSSEVDNVTITANRMLTPRYKLLSGFNYKSNDFKRRTLLSRDESQYELGLRYTSLAGNTIDFIVQNTDAQYPNRNPEDISRGLDDGYTDNSLLTRVDWQPTHKSKFEFELGYISREQDTITEDDFDGVVGELNYHWAISGKSKIITTAWRGLRDSEDQVANFMESTGVSIEFDWDVTPKIDVNAKISSEKHDYQAGSQSTNVSNRDDDLFYGRLGVGYKLRRNVTVITDYLYETRDSNRPLRKYDNNVFGLSVKLDF